MPAPCLKNLFPEPEEYQPSKAIKYTYVDYEQKKKEVQRMGLSPIDHECAMRAIAEEMNL